MHFNYIFISIDTKLTDPTEKERLVHQHSAPGKC